MNTLNKIKYITVLFLWMLVGIVQAQEIDEIDPTLLIDCDQCKSFKPTKGKYIVSGWVKEGHSEQVSHYSNAAIVINQTQNNGDLVVNSFTPSGRIIDGWQRITGIFEVLDRSVYLGVDLVNLGTEGNNDDTPDSDVLSNFTIEPEGIDQVKAGYTVKIFNDPVDFCQNVSSETSDINIASNTPLDVGGIYRIKGDDTGVLRFVEVITYRIVPNKLAGKDVNNVLTHRLDQGCSALDLQGQESDQTSNVTVYFDDIRIHPFNGNMKSFVYDPQTQRLMAELDENNYATLYEYDQEGGLIRVKKETEKGIYTIQETRSSGPTFREGTGIKGIPPIQTGGVQ